MIADTLKGRDFVIVGIQSIDDEVGNIKNIAYEIAKNNRVVFVHLPVDRITYLRSKHNPSIKKKLEVLKGKREALEKVGENLWSYYPRIITESINWIKAASAFDFLNKINSKRFAKEIQKAIKLLGFNNVILINDNDFFRSQYLKEFLEPHLNIYYMRDYFTYLSYWKTHGERLEPQLIEKTDLAVTNSIFLTNHCKKYNENAYYVGQGCDLSLFTKEKVKPTPNDIASIPRPIIGYVGSLVYTRLCIDTISYIANERKDWNLVFIGPEDEVFKNSKLHELPNVFFLGKKPISEAPTYLDHFDVCINPQLININTVGNYPLKIDEYLAMGKPVVATETEAMEIFKDHVHLAKNMEDYVLKIEKALSEINNEELQTERRKFAASHSWENNVKEIYKAIIALEAKYN